MQPYGDKLSFCTGPLILGTRTALTSESLDGSSACCASMYAFIVIDLSHWLDELFLKVLTEADMVIDADRAYHS